MSTTHILVVTGASGAGKTATVQALDERQLAGVRCFHFDSIGVPTTDDMEREYGGGEQWQAAATNHWLAHLGTLADDVRIAVLDGQTRPAFVLDAVPRAAPRAVHVVLLDCASDVRSARLRGPRRQPELDSARMNNWAAYLRGQADALQLLVIDTTTRTIEEAADELELLVRRLIDSTVPVV